MKETAAKLADLLALCEKATPGPTLLRNMDTYPDNPDMWIVERDVKDGAGKWVATFPALRGKFLMQQRDDARLIAACSPEVVAALVRVAMAADQRSIYAVPGWR